MVICQHILMPAGNNRGNNTVSPTAARFLNKKDRALFFVLSPAWELFKNAVSLNYCQTTLHFNMRRSNDMPKHNLHLYQQLDSLHLSGPWGESVISLSSKDT